MGALTGPPKHFLLLLVFLMALLFKSETQNTWHKGSEEGEKDNTTSVNITQYSKWELGPRKTVMRQIQEIGKWGHAPFLESSDE